MTLTPLFVLWMIVVSPNQVGYLPIKTFEGEELCQSYARAYNRAEKDVWIRYECKELYATNR